MRSAENEKNEKKNLVGGAEHSVMAGPDHTITVCTPYITPHSGSPFAWTTRTRILLHSYYSYSLTQVKL